MVIKLSCCSNVAILTHYSVIYSYNKKLKISGALTPATVYKHYLTSVVYGMSLI